MDTKISFLLKTPIAHRGLNNDNIPENSLMAFTEAVKCGYNIELDVQMLATGEIVVFHDENTLRLTGQDNLIQSLKYEDIKKLRLSSTSQQIPTFEQVLSVVDGKVGILIEIKNHKNIGILEDKLINILKNYNGAHAIQSFNPFIIKYIKKNAPQIPCGQLSSYFENENMSKFLKFILKHMFLNHFIKPDFISYNVEQLPNKYVRKFRHIPLLAWTVRSLQKWNSIKNYCDNIIFEGFLPNINM